VKKLKAIIITVFTFGGFLTWLWRESAHRPEQVNTVDEDEERFCFLSYNMRPNGDTTAWREWSNKDRGRRVRPPRPD